MQPIPISGQRIAAGVRDKVRAGELTPREKQVLLLIADGLSSREIAQQLGISFKTATSHRSNILTKLGVHEAILAVRWAIRNGLLKP
jgi:DNA-binding NarL/FixJ family response regulator